MYSVVCQARLFLSGILCTYDVEGVRDPETHEIPCSPLTAFWLDFDLGQLQLVEQGVHWNKPGFKSKFVNINWALVRPGSDDTANLSTILATFEPLTFSMMAVMRPAGLCREYFRRVLVCRERFEGPSR